ncbi:hypothetical protein JTB14_037611 [Gonioctena quinquepunctata]|nr:hypothetical protein JTB14_037611 [Gonioctena quinquepunctata]
MESMQTSSETSEPHNATTQNGEVDMARIEPEQVLSDKTTRRNRSFSKQHYDGTESEPGQGFQKNGSTNVSRDVSRTSSFKSETKDERKKSLSDLAQEEVKYFLNKTKKSLAAAATRGRERFRKHEKQQVKRSQSAPHEFTEAELIESFRRAQMLSAQNERVRKFSDNSLQSLATEEPIVPKPLRPEAQSVIRQRKRQRAYSEKIVEILDPETILSRKPVPLAKPPDISPLDIFRVLRYVSVFEIYRCYKLHKIENKQEYRRIKLLWNKCMLELFLIVVFCGLGAFIFKFTEGGFENFYKCGVKRVKRDFIDLLWMKSHSLREEDWKSLARNKLRTFEEELHVAHEAGMTTYSGQRSWSFLNGVVYTFTIITTIGYGHLYPSTTTGRALTIVYSIIGIPLFLIALTDFGKLFTRGIKFLWSFVRRVYYTGNCRSYRKTAHVQEIFKGAQLMYDIATFRRSSNIDVPDPENPQPSKSSKSGVPTTASITVTDDDTPTSPAISNFEINDEFNLPISVALFILITYIFCGALIYFVWEGWDFFASFYFVFISMSTIGFGDFVPKHPICMMVSIVYLVFGLALMSMWATIGFEVDESGSAITVDNIQTVPSEPLVPIHRSTSKESSGGDIKEDNSPNRDSEQGEKADEK